MPLGVGMRALESTEVEIVQHVERQLEVQISDRIVDIERHDLADVRRTPRIGDHLEREAAERPDRPR